MIPLRNIGASLALNLLLFALMAFTVKTSLTEINIPSKPIDFTWIEKKAPKGKDGTKTVKPKVIRKPVAKESVKPAPPAQNLADKKPEPMLQKEKRPQPVPVEPLRKKTEADKIVKPHPSTAPRTNASPNESVEMDSKTYFERKKLSHPPGFLFRPPPQYPPLARRMGKEGEVILEIWLEPDGSIAKIFTVKSAGWGFDKAALKAASASRFTPGKIEGRPVRSKVLAPYIFRFKATYK